MSVEVNMPRLGMTMKQGTIVNWLKSEGDPIKKGETLAEITSDKTAYEIDSPSEGYLGELLVSEGDSVDVGTVITHIEEESSVKTSSETSKEKKEVTDSKEVLEKIPYSGIRKTIGDRMKSSIQNQPQGTMTTKADISKVLDLKKEYSEKNMKLSLTDIFIKVTACALSEYPILNSAIVDDMIVKYRSINIGVGVGLDDSLYVPVIENVQDKDLIEISQDFKNLAKKVLDKTITNEEMKNGTFTISNMGMYDVDVVTAIINPPQSAILSIGTSRKELVLNDNDETEVKNVTTLSLTADHRVTDGIPVVKFLAYMKKILENPKDYIL